MIGFIILTILLVCVDQFSKWLVVSLIPLNTGIAVVPNIFSIFYIRNTGAAWGVLSGNMSIFFIVTIVIVAALIYYLMKEKRHRMEYIAGIFILAGAIGNFIDRVRLGYVVDMFKLDFIDFPIFNVADICLTLGVVLFLYYGFFIENKGD